MVKLPDEPSPVPAGISASVVISICMGSSGNCLSDSRTIGCWTSSILSTCSIRESVRAIRCALHALVQFLLPGVRLRPRMCTQPTSISASTVPLLTITPRMSSISARVTGWW